MLVQGGEMNTRPSLLQHAQDGKSEAWQKLVDLYQPLITRWLRKNRIAEFDAADISQEVLLTVTQQIASFEHNGRVGAFRSWLRQITVNRCREHWQRNRRNKSGSENIDQILQELEDETSELSQKMGTRARLTRSECPH